MAVSCIRNSDLTGDFLNKIFTRPDAHISFGFCGKIRTTVHEQSAPAFMQGVRALFVTDVHLRPSASDAWLEHLMTLIASAQPDLLLLGGDYGESVDQQERFFRAIAALPAFPLGAFGVIGNNDRERFPETDRLRALMAENGVHLLLNEAVAVPVGSGMLAISGADEMKYGHPRTKGLFDRCPQGAYRLLLSHYPLWPETHADLILAGHTHGGQLNAFGLTPYSIGYERNLLPCIRGRSEKDGMTLVVSRGIGYSSLPVRVGAFPEAILCKFAK